MRQIYLDYAATTPLLPEVKRVMEPYLLRQFYNPSAPYLAAKAVANDLEAARARIAHWLGARPPEIVFTAGGTEANNLAINGVMQQYPKANIVVSSIEHEAVLEPAARYDCHLVKVSADGIVDIADLEKRIDDKTVLLSVMYANNEVGTIQPIAKIAALVRAVRQERAKKGNNLPLYLHTDACQAGAYLDLHAQRLGVDLMTINAGKIYGPKQCGALYVRSGLELQPQILGGGQERRLRSGTQNVANIIGFAIALDIVQSSRRQEADRVGALRDKFIELLRAAVPSIVFNGSDRHHLPNNVHVTIPGIDNERVMMKLDEMGIQCAVGSACSASNEEPSHVLRAMAISEADAQSSLRFSFGRETTAKDVERTVKALVDCLPA